MRGARCLALAVALVACGKQGWLEVSVVTPAGQDPFVGAVAARLTLGTTPPIVREFPIVGGRIDGEIQQAPVGVAATVTVELLDAAGDVLARGRTPEIPLSSALGDSVDVFVARVGAFAALPGRLDTATRGHGAALIGIPATGLRLFGVLVVGGVEANGAPSARAEIYNPYAFDFVVASASLSTPRARPAVLPLAGGKVLFFGGLVTGPLGGLVPTATAEAYDVAANVFTGEQGAGDPRSRPTALPLPDSPDRWLVAGGDGTEGPLASALVFDTNTGELTAVGPMNARRAGHSATAVQTTTGPAVLLYGGASEGPEAELFDPASRRFAPLAGPDRRSDHTATLLPDGRVLIAGGRDPDGAARRDLVLYDGRCDGVRCAVFSPVPGFALLHGRWGHVAHALPGNRVLLAAGRDDSGTPTHTAEVLRYDPQGGSVSRESSPSLVSPRAEFTSTELPTGPILFVGGVDASGAPVRGIEIFNPR